MRGKCPKTYYSYFSGNFFGETEKTIKEWLAETH